jgi:hypothetical protein
MPEPDAYSGSPHYLPNTNHALPPDATHPYVPVRMDLFASPTLGPDNPVYGYPGRLLLRLQSRFDEVEPVVAPEHLVADEEGWGPEDAPLYRF